MTISTVGTIVEDAVSSLMDQSEEMLVLDTAFGTPVREIHGKFLAIPSPQLLNALIERLVV